MRYAQSERNLKKIKMTKGPFFWSERESAADKYSKYWRRRYQVNTLDYNKDGINEISVTFKSSSEVYFYQRDGIWSKI